jgi:hypothetical protein
VRLSMKAAAEEDAGGAAPVAPAPAPAPVSTEPEPMGPAD